jgi:superfamily II DNA or RNA helicase
METEFSIGQLVCLKVDTARQGPVIEVMPAVAGRIRYRVFHSPSEIREYYHEQLVLAGQPSGGASGPMGLAQDRLLSAEEFCARLTALRLANPLTDNLYALHAARIQFIPFQFKPLLRLLRSDRPRLLVADEVGVGKTIEAGLMLKELQSRQRLENVIIVCPKALVTKWRAEMRRFDEDFHPLKAETLRYCLREAHLDGAWPAKYARAIVHLELFRNPDYLFGSEGRNPRPGLASLDPPAQFSLAIFDEAHHLRNTDTNSNQLARFICDNSEAAIFLSATPVHLGSRNLFTLVNLLRPDLFPDEAVFREMIEPNRHVNQAIRHVRSRQPADSWTRDAVACLNSAAATSWGTRTLTTDPRFRDCLGALASPSAPADVDRIRCLRDLEELHTLAHVMNRTRRRDIGRFTVREPHTVSVPFTSAQEEFYRALIEFRTQVLLLRYDPLVIRLIVDMLERQAASCLPALLPALDAFIETGRFSAARITDDWDDENEDVELPEPLLRQADALRAQARQLSPDDPKLEALLGIARTTVEAAGPRKLLVFSFFIHTLRYLEHHLKAAGFRVGIITGQTPDDLDEDSYRGINEPTRGQLRDRFRRPFSDSDALDILLSSEVGCEGLDYEFCDRLVNYDIPWNPMRLEQRIGRIDRFGQRADKVFIFNFITPGTVEERIFFRCFERLGIFRDTVGDCEEVLGEMAVTEQLLEIARNPQLTPGQAEAKARQIADNALRVLEEQRRLEQEGGALLGLDQALTDEAASAQAEGRFISPHELRAMIQFFLARPEYGGALESDREDLALFRLRLNKEARAALAHKLRSWQPPDRSLTAFRRWLDGAEPHLLVTFDQATAVERRDLPFITPVHPLARLATEALKHPQQPLAARLRVNSMEVPAGIYVFACDLWETVAIRPELRLVPLAWSLAGQRDAPELAQRLLLLFNRTETAGSLCADQPGIELALAGLDERIHRERDAALSALAVHNARLVELKLASLDVYHRNRLARIQAELANAGEERIRRMKTAELARADREHVVRRAEIEHRRQADIIRERVAIGILEVNP